MTTDVSLCLQVSVSQQGLSPQTVSSVETFVSSVTMSRGRSVGSALCHSDVQDLPVHLRCCSGRSVPFCPRLSQCDRQLYHMLIINVMVCRCDRQVYRAEGPSGLHAADL